MGPFLTRLIEAQSRWAMPLGDRLHDWFHAFFHAVPALRDFLNGRWLGHPLHPALTDVPIGVLGVAVVLDLIGQPYAATVALALALLGLVGSAVAGLADYADTDGTARVRATLHGTIMSVATILAAIAFAARASDWSATSGAVLALELVALLLIVAGAYVGGDVVYVLGNMVDRHAFRGGGSKWISLEPAETDADGSIPEGKLVKAKLGINTLVLIRQGERILALHDQCAHAGGPLSGGSVVGDTVECPWHGSRFRLADGRVARGPSVYDQPAYEVRRTEAGGWEARRSR